MNIRQTIQRHPTITYFALAYAISWGGILLLVGSKVAQRIPLQMLDIGFIFLAMLVGPSVAGLTMTALMDGRNGLHSLLIRMRHWRVAIRWYGVALLITPVLLIIVLLTLAGLVSAKFLPGFMPLGIVIGLAAGFFEEIGWTGFALPRLQSKYSPLTAGLLLGFLWAAWHFLGATLGGQSLPSFLIFAVSIWAYRVLMTWVYTHTGSLLLAQLMHAFYTGSLSLLSPSLSAGESLLFTGILAAAFWVVVAVVVITTGSRLVRGPRQALAPI